MNERSFNYMASEPRRQAISRIFPAAILRWILPGSVPAEAGITMVWAPQECSPHGFEFPATGATFCARKQGRAYSEGNKMKSTRSKRGDHEIASVYASRKRGQRSGLAAGGGQAILAVAISVALAGCSIQRTVVDMVGDSLSNGGTVYASDGDPELIKEALPFGLKTYESLLAVSPRHRGLLLASAKGFTAYAYLLQDEADRLPASEYRQARALRARAKRLYLRGRNYAIKGLADGRDGFATRLAANPVVALRQASKDDVAFLYWAGAAWAAALSAAKDDMALIAEMSIAESLVRRSLQLDETYERGVAHEFFIAYEGSRPGGSEKAALRHFDRARELSGGSRASVYLALAETVAVRRQDLKQFRSLVDAALAVDVDAVSDLRLVNTIAHRRALWLRARTGDLFLIAETAGES